MATPAHSGPPPPPFIYPLIGRQGGLMTETDRIKERFAEHFRQRCQAKMPAPFQQVATWTFMQALISFKKTTTIPHNNQLVKSLPKRPFKEAAVMAMMCIVFWGQQRLQNISRFQAVFRKHEWLKSIPHCVGLIPVNQVRCGNSKRRPRTSTRKGTRTGKATSRPHGLGDDAERIRETVRQQIQALVEPVLDKLRSENKTAMDNMQDLGRDMVAKVEYQVSAMKESARHLTELASAQAQAQTIAVVEPGTVTGNGKSLPICRYLIPPRRPLA
ncbi:hypothetical protein E4U21_003678 [Claviceps maximensis]|nr:hypothetical protein E4U21_003678 [Claviceps maximensis]